MARQVRILARGGAVHVKIEFGYIDTVSHYFRIAQPQIDPA